MKTVVLSDIHVDINREHPVVQEFARYIKEQDARLAIIAGDVSEIQQETLDTLNTIEQLSGARVLFVPGNHDLWGPPGDPDQIAAIYDRYVQDEHCLCGRDVVLGDTVVIGDVGWYDYSFGSGRYSFEEFEKMSLAGRTWQDSLRNAWTRDNLGRTQWMLSRLEARMAAYPDKQLAVVTHMLPVKDFTVPAEMANWSYFNAFLGSRKFGELYRRYPVKAAVCGHVHYRRSFDRDGIHWMCRCLNYHSEWRPQDGETLREQIEKAAEVIEL